MLLPVCMETPETYPYTSPNPRADSYTMKESYTDSKLTLFTDVSFFYYGFWWFTSKNCTVARNRFWQIPMQYAANVVGSVAISTALDTSMSSRKNNQSSMSLLHQYGADSRHIDLSLVHMTMNDL